MIELLKILRSRNSFRVYTNGYIHPPMIPSKELQNDLVESISNLEENSVFVGHINYLNFSDFGRQSPIYINLIRDPIDRLISAHYYNRRPDIIKKLKEIRPWAKEKDPKWTELDFNECVRNKLLECTFEYGNTFADSYWSRQMLYFCGTDKICESFNSKEALQKAKHNVENEYAVVGSWEDTNMTLAILEHTIPRFFSGATKIFYEHFERIRGRNKGSHPSVDSDVRKMLKANFTNEYEFYYFCKQRLYKQFLALNKLY